MLGLDINLKNRLPFIIIGSAIVLSLLYLSLGPIIIYAVSKTYGLNISYKSLRNNTHRGLYFTELTVTDKKKGIGLFSREACLEPDLLLWSIKKISFDLKDVYFIRGKGTQVRTAARTADNPMWFVLTPFNSGWKYENITGEIAAIKEGIRVKNMAASGAEIRLVLSGDIKFNGAIDLNVKVHFLKDLVQKLQMPDDVTGYFLADEKDGGKSISAVLKGNYGSPSIELSSPAFRLNIKETVP